MTKGTPPDRLYEAWREGRFVLLTAEQQLEELRRVTRRLGVRLRINPAEAGRMVNDLRGAATVVGQLPAVDVSPDPYDNFLLALAQAGHADLLVSGDRRGLLSIEVHQGTRIVTARAAVDMVGG